MRISLGFRSHHFLWAGLAAFLSATLHFWALDPGLRGNPLDGFLRFADQGLKFAEWVGLVVLLALRMMGGDAPALLVSSTVCSGCARLDCWMLQVPAAAEWLCPV
jgi:hypothetical protein